MRAALAKLDAFDRGALAVCFVVLGAIAYDLTGCASVPAPPVDTMALVAQRNAAEMDCVTVSATYAAEQACINDVQAHYCGDGGALVSSGGCPDGGAR